MPASLKSHLTDWQALVDSLKPRLADLLNLAADHAALSSVVARGIVLEGQRDLHRANLRDVNRQRIALAAEGRILKQRLAAGLRRAAKIAAP
jgi:hypothetical protein